MLASYFDIDEKYDLSNKNLLKDDLDELEEKQNSPQYAIILHNDPLNGIEFVIKVIKEVFAYSTRKSVWLMLKAHFAGRSQLWIGDEKEARKKRQLMIAFGPDPSMSHKNPEPLTVTVELYDK